MSSLTSDRNTMLFVKLFFLAAGLVAGLILVQAAPAQTNDFAARRFAAPTVFQAAGPSASSIQSTVDQFFARLSEPPTMLIIPDR